MFAPPQNIAKQHLPHNGTLWGKMHINFCNKKEHYQRFSMMKSSQTGYYVHI